jgi:hypothetical protein
VSCPSRFHCSPSVSAAASARRRGSRPARASRR